MGEGGESGALPEFGGTRGQEVPIPTPISPNPSSSLNVLPSRLGMRRCGKLGFRRHSRAKDTMTAPDLYGLNDIVSGS